MNRPRHRAGAHLLDLSLIGLVSIALGGCLPSSQRQNDRSLTPSDSASVAMAVDVPVDTLTFVGDASTPEAAPMLMPTSIAWRSSTPDGGFVVADTQGGSLHFFSGDGTYQSRMPVDSESSAPYPYLAGVRGDTVVVLARGTDQMLWVLPDGSVAKVIDVPQGASSAVATDSLVAVRVGGGMQQDVPAAVNVLDESGAVRASHRLQGPSWRSSGFVRPWGPALIALSGYRPVVDIIDDPSVVGSADTLAFAGFDSPQLVRSAQFMRGEVNGPPLLTSSAVGIGDRLFVLNLRTDHVRIDVYGRDGRLQHVLVSPGPWQPLPRVPVDIVALGGPESGYEFAVLMQRQSGVFQTASSLVRRFRWSPLQE